MKIKMLGKFIVWLIGKFVKIVFKRPAMSFVEAFIEAKKLARTSLSMTLVSYVLASCFSVTVYCVLASVLCMSKDLDSTITSLIASVTPVTLFYLSALIASWYDMFIEDYEKTFTILKE